MALVIKGHIVPMAKADVMAAFAGRVYLGDAGLVDAVTKEGDAVPSGFAAAKLVDVGDALVIPGLIDLHNHLGYNALPLWSEPTRKVPFKDHNTWPAAASYKPKISWPAWALANGDPEALMAYVQVRALVGGTTAIQGWPSANRSPLKIIRCIDDEMAGTTNRNLIYTSTLTETPAQLAVSAQEIGKGAGFVYHCSEGQSGSTAAREFQDAALAGCLAPTFIAIHCNAVADADWVRWVAAKAGAVVWSPFSNLWLYGSTTNIPAVLKQGVTVCLGSDWGPSGTKHVLGEVKVAKIVAAKQGFALADHDLVAMVTTNPGDVLTRCWSRQAGRLEAGAFGDVTVLAAKKKGDVWSQIVNARESDVRLVVVGGQPQYGTTPLMTAAGARTTTTLTIGSAKRTLSLPDPQDSTKALTWTSVLARLKAVRDNPQKAVAHAHGEREMFTGSMMAAGAPLRLALDMPSGGAMAFAGPPPKGTKVDVPPLPTLLHDAAFFSDVHAGGFHAGVLDGLAAFYK